MTALANRSVGTVDVTDGLTKAIDAAFERARTVFAESGPTLVDQISAEEWHAWDASDERALVQDSDGLDAVEPCDDEDLDQAA